MIPANRFNQLINNSTINLAFIASLEQAENADMLYVPDNNGFTPIARAASENQHAMFELLIHIYRKRGWDLAQLNATLTGVRHEKKTPLLIAAEAGHAEVVRIFLGSGIAPEILHRTDARGRTPLYIAMQTGRVEVVRTFLEQAENANMLYEPIGNSFTPIGIAAFNNQWAVIELLIQIYRNRGWDLAQLNTPPGAGPANKTPLSIAAERGHIEVVRAFLSSGIAFEALHQADAMGGTPCYFAVLNGRVDVIKSFLEHAENANILYAPTKNGFTPIAMAASGNQQAVIELLIQIYQDRGWDLAQLNTPLTGAGFSNRTPLFIAAERGHVGIVRAFLQSGIKSEVLHKADVSGMTPCYFAALNGRVDVIRTFLEQAENADILYVPTNDGWTAVAAAASGNQQAVIELLIQIYQDRGWDLAQLNIPYTGVGHTPLFIAAEKGHIGIVRVFLASGIEPKKLHRPINNNKTPYLIAKEKNHIDVIKAFEQSVDMSTLLSVDKLLISIPAKPSQSPVVSTTENTMAVVSTNTPMEFFNKLTRNFSVNFAFIIKSKEQEVTKLAVVNQPMVDQYPILGYIWTSGNVQEKASKINELQQVAKIAFKMPEGENEQNNFTSRLKGLEEFTSRNQGDENINSFLEYLASYIVKLESELDISSKKKALKIFPYTEVDIYDKCIPEVHDHLIQAMVFLERKGTLRSDLLSAFDNYVVNTCLIKYNLTQYVMENIESHIPAALQVLLGVNTNAIKDITHTLPLKDIPAHIQYQIIRDIEQWQEPTEIFFEKAQKSFLEFFQELKNAVQIKNPSSGIIKALNDHAFIALINDLYTDITFKIDLSQHHREEDDGYYLDEDKIFFSIQDFLSFSSLARTAQEENNTISSRQTTNYYCQIIIDNRVDEVKALLLSNNYADFKHGFFILYFLSVNTIGNCPIVFLNVMRELGFNLDKLEKNRNLWVNIFENKLITLGLAYLLERLNNIKIQFENHRKAYPIYLNQLEATPTEKILELLKGGAPLSMLQSFVPDLSVLEKVDPTNLRVNQGIDVSYLLFRLDGLDIFQTYHSYINLSGRLGKMIFFAMAKYNKPEFLNNVPGLYQIFWEVFPRNTIAQETPIHVAAKKGHVEALQVFLSEERNINTLQIKNAAHLSLLEIAVLENQSQVIVWLTQVYKERGWDLRELNAPITKEGYENQRPFFLAAKKGYVNVVDAFLTSGITSADLHQADVTGHTPCYVAAQHGHVGVLRSLLEHAENSDILRVSIQGFTPIGIATIGNKLEIIKLLVEIYSARDWNLAELNAPLSLLVLREQAEYITLVRTPLYIAAEKGYADIVRVFLSSGIEYEDLHQANEGGYTPIAQAVMQNHIPVVELILKFYEEHDDDIAKLNAPLARLEGKTPLYLAAEHGHADIVRIFLYSQIDLRTLHRPANNGLTPYVATINNRHTAAIEAFENSATSRQALLFDYPSRSSFFGFARASAPVPLAASELSADSSAPAAGLPISMKIMILGGFVTMFVLALYGQYILTRFGIKESAPKPSGDNSFVIACSSLGYCNIIPR